jgi:antitoxin component YwqK of YwqJK toxin-antitoxin module
MRRILTSVVLIGFLFPALALGEKMEDLVITDGLHYKKFTDVPFTGGITGKVQGSFKKGNWDGPWVSYHDNGQLLGKGNYKDGKLDGPWVWYHDNGQLSGKGTWKDGKLDGPWVWYHDNGQLRSKGTYKDGKRDGPWVYYNRDGIVDENWTGTFKDGKKVN